MQHNLCSLSKSLEIYTMWKSEWDEPMLKEVGDISYHESCFKENSDKFQSLDSDGSGGLEIMQFRIRKMNNIAQEDLQVKNKIFYRLSILFVDFSNNFEEMKYSVAINYIWGIGQMMDCRTRNDSIISCCLKKLFP